MIQVASQNKVAKSGRSKAVEGIEPQAPQCTRFVVAHIKTRNAMIPCKPDASGLGLPALR